jgi:apolipoprotein N-acyltransferase
MSRFFFRAVVSALLLAAPFLWPMLFPLAWVAFVPLLRVINEVESLRGAGLCGWLTGLLAHLVGFHWLIYTISVFGGFPYPVSAVLFLAYAALQGLQMAIFAVLVKRFGYGPLSLFPSAFWVAIEFWFPLLFPWHLANSQSSFTSFIQTGDLVGPYGASFLVMWCNAIIARTQFKTVRDAKTLWTPAALCAAGVVGSLVYGSVRLDRVAQEMKAAPKLSVAAVQANIEVGMKWDPKRMKANLLAHIKLTREITGAQVVIWPESAIEEWVPENLAQLPNELIDLLELQSAYFIFGARSFRGSLAGPDFKAFNTAFLTDAQGRALGYYHKQVLLAFGEYLPFSHILSKLPAMPFADGFTPGDGPNTLDLSPEQRLALLICYEDLMPELSREFVRQKKANLLVNITNDAWYGQTVAPWQHARLSQLRAIETRRTLLRVTNTGTTTVIDARGEFAQSLPIFTAAVMNSNVELLQGQTLYVRFGDWFAWGMTILSLAVIIFNFKRALSAGNG